MLLWGRLRFDLPWRRAGQQIGQERPLNRLLRWSYRIEWLTIELGMISRKVEPMGRQR